MRGVWRGAFAAVLGGALIVSAQAPASAAKPVFPAASGFLVDAAGVIPDTAESEIERSLEGYHRRTDGEVAIAVVRTIGDTSIENYAEDLFGKWGVGDEKRDLGVLLVIALNERRTRIETGYGAEAYLTDVQSRQILTQVEQLLGQGNYAGAVDRGQSAIRRALGDDQADAAAPAPVPQPRQRRSSGGGSIFFLLFMLLFVFGGIGGGRSRRRRRGGGFGVPIILGGGFGGGYGGGLGGFGGGGGGGGGGGFGGFGGGDSGGGGASGSW